MVKTNTGLESKAAALYDGGWRTNDQDQLQTEYELSKEEAEDICELLEEYEKKKLKYWSLEVDSKKYYITEPPHYATRRNDNYPNDLGYMESNAIDETENQYIIGWDVTEKGVALLKENDDDEDLCDWYNPCNIYAL